MRRNRVAAIDRQAALAAGPPPQRVQFASDADWHPAQETWVQLWTELRIPDLAKPGARRLWWKQIKKHHARWCFGRRGKPAIDVDIHSGSPPRLPPPVAARGDVAVGMLIEHPDGAIGRVISRAALDHHQYEVLWHHRAQHTRHETLTGSRGVLRWRSVQPSTAGLLADTATRADSHEADETCLICLDAFQAGDSVTFGLCECKRLYHTDCLRRHMSEGSSCKRLRCPHCDGRLGRKIVDGNVYTFQ